MKHPNTSTYLFTLSMLLSGTALSAASNGLAPEVTDLNSADISYALEAKLPDLEQPYISTTPDAKADGIAVGQLGIDGGDSATVLHYAQTIADGQRGITDSLLIAQHGKLLFESYYRRGRANYPHYQMSITKSYTAMALGRAIQLGYISMAELDKPVVSFLTEIDPSKLVAGADRITLAEAMNMHSGIRIDKTAVAKLMKQKNQLQGQGQIESYLAHSAPIPPSPREYKYQGADPSITMQVLEVIVPGSARDFIRDQLLAPMGITNYHWQDDLSGLPKAAAGSSFTSRDMLKWGTLILNDGKWNGKQHIPAAFVKQATSMIHTNPAGSSYGYFWWSSTIQIEGKAMHCITGRGAGGQFIIVVKDLDLVIVTTSHNKGMGKALKTIPAELIPVFTK